MQVEVKIDSAYAEPKVIVLTSAMTEEVNRLVKKLSEDFPKMLAGSSFVRISNSEMINLKKVEHFDLSFTGTIYVKLSNQTGIYFVVVCAAMMPTAYLLYWMEHSIAGFVQYLIMFVIIFAFVWISQYWIMMRKIRAINAKLQ